MARWLGSVVAAFLFVLIPQGAAAMFGDRIIAQLPSGSAVANWFNSFITWLTTPNAAISYIALFFGVVLAFAVHSCLLPQGAAVVMVMCFSAAVWLALTYRWSNPMSVTTFWADPALWIMLAGLLAPVVLWSAHRALGPTVLKWLDTLMERFLDGRTQVVEPTDEQPKTIRT